MPDQLGGRAHIGSSLKRSKAVRRAPQCFLRAIRQGGQKVTEKPAVVIHAGGPSFRRTYLQRGLQSIKIMVMSVLNVLNIGPEGLILVWAVIVSVVVALLSWRRVGPDRIPAGDAGRRRGAGRLGDLHRSTPPASAISFCARLSSSSRAHCCWELRVSAGWRAGRGCWCSSGRSCSSDASSASASARTASSAPDPAPLSNATPHPRLRRAGIVGLAARRLRADVIGELRAGEVAGRALIHLRQHRRVPVVPLAPRAGRRHPCAAPSGWRAPSDPRRR